MYSQGNPQGYYNLRPKQQKAFVLVATLVPFYLMMFLVIITLFISHTLFRVLFTSPIIFILIALTLISSFFIFFKAKKTMPTVELLVDEYGVRTNSHWLGLIPNFTPVKWQNNLAAIQAENFGKKMLGALARFDKNLKEYDTAILIVEKKLVDKPRFIISNAVWEIDDLNELKQLLAYYNFPVEVTSTDDTIKKYVPQAADMGKQAGTLAYSSVGLLAIGFGILLLDKYATLEFGYLKYILMAFGALTAALGYRWITKTNPDNKNGIIVLLIFVPMAVFCFFSLILTISPLLAEKTNLTFKFKESKPKYAVWVQKDEPKHEIFCTEIDPKNKADRVVPTIRTLSMTRIKLARLCLPDKPD